MLNTADPPIDRRLVKFFIRTLGCKMNLLDSSRVAAALSRSGYEQAATEEEADLIVVNTCTVTAESERKSRRAARSAGRDAKRVAVVGCGPRVNLKAWIRQVPQAEVFGSEQEFLGAFALSQVTEVLPIEWRIRVPIPVQYGCDGVCSYCITRVARGLHASEPADRVIRRVLEAERLGVSEVVLTGINLGAWGCTNSQRERESRLHELLTSLLSETNIHRIRLSSLGPQYLHDPFFEVLGDPRVCDHLHLSVQSGSPDVLRRMARGHGVEEVRAAAERARRARPHVALTADFIVGFPGETEQAFAETMALVDELGFAKLHVFPFSARAGTPAASMSGQVRPGVKKARAAALRERGRGLRREFLQSQHQRRVEVLLEGDGTAMTTNYLRLRVDDGERGALRWVVLDREQFVEVR